MDACFLEAAFEFPAAGAAALPLLLFSGVLTTGSGFFFAAASASLSLSLAEAISFLVTMKPSSSRNVLLKGRASDDHFIMMLKSCDYQIVLCLLNGSFISKKL